MRMFGQPAFIRELVGTLPGGTSVTMTFLHELKREIRASHERFARFAPLLRQDLSLDAYRAYLERLLGFYEPVEVALAAHAWESVQIGAP